MLKRLSLVLVIFFSFCGVFATRWEDPVKKEIGDCKVDWPEPVESIERSTPRFRRIAIVTSDRPVAKWSGGHSMSFAMRTGGAESIDLIEHGQMLTVSLLHGQSDQTGAARGFMYYGQNQHQGCIVSSTAITGFSLAWLWLVEFVRTFVSSFVLTLLSSVGFVVFLFAPIGAAVEYIKPTSQEILRSDRREQQDGSVSIVTADDGRLSLPADEDGRR